MNKIHISILIVGVVLIGWFGWTKIKNIPHADPAVVENTSIPMYTNKSLGISLRVPFEIGTTSTDVYVPNESYVYYANPQTKISGVKFTIPKSMADGTNLAHDTYISVETMPNVSDCSANLFLDGIHSTVREVSRTAQVYSVASSTGAGAGNRYEETVYALSGSNPCIAVRYFIHYGVLQNYDPGTVREFDQEALLLNFDAIRQTLKINQ